jgi:hypothetical protein
MDRDTKMPAATAAVVGQNKVSAGERIINSKISAKLKEVNPAAQRHIPDVLEKKRRGWDGHSSD